MIVNNISINSNFFSEPICLTIGNFDGIHHGHEFIINKLVKKSNELKIQSAVLSFAPHPSEFFKKYDENFNILTEDNKEKLLESLGINILYKLKFDQETASTTPENFITKLLIEKLNTKCLVIGENFRFGKKRKGNIDLLMKYSKEKKFQLHVVNSIKSNFANEIFSSSIIRNYIKSGKIEIANRLLNKLWSIKGIVIKGDKRARKMNFPTANIIPTEIITPKKGVYIVRVIYNDKKYNGIANFGKRPTFNSDKFLLEVNIFDFNEEIYGKELTIEFLAFIREEKKFDNFEKLKDQVEKDVQTTKEYFAKKKINLNGI